MCLCKNQTVILLISRFLFRKRSLSAIIAINSEFVGFPREELMEYPKIEFKTSTSPLSHATYIACLIARSTREGDVLYCFATVG